MKKIEPRNNPEAGPKRGFYMIRFSVICMVMNNLFIKNDMLLFMCALVSLTAVLLILYDAVKAMSASKDGDREKV